MHVLTLEHGPADGLRLELPFMVDVPFLDVMVHESQRVVRYTATLDEPATLQPSGEQFELGTYRPNHLTIPHTFLPITEDIPV